MTEKKKRSLPFDVGDLASIAGVGLIIYAAYQVYVPAAYAIGGLLLLAIGISIHRHKNRSI